MPAKLVWLDPAASDVPVDPASDPSLLVELDFGEIVAPGEKTLPFKLGNVGDSAAEDISLTMIGPSNDLSYGWKFLSTDGGATFGSEPLSKAYAMVGNLAPGTLSDALFLKSRPPAISDSVPTGDHVSTLVVDYIYV